MMAGSGRMEDMWAVGDRVAERCHYKSAGVWVLKGLMSLSAPDRRLRHWRTRLPAEAETYTEVARARNDE